MLRPKESAAREVLGPRLLGVDTNELRANEGSWPAQLSQRVCCVGSFESIPGLGGKDALGAAAIQTLWAFMKRERVTFM